MLQAFAANIRTKSFFTPNNSILIAVSGGVDSMVLCDLMFKLKYPFSIAHCNFKLRGNESEADEQFIKDYCTANNIQFFSRSFNTTAYSTENSVSIQMAARELRYSYFNELLQNNSFDILLTAHHLNDSIETFFINLIRGTGINGLKGIEEKRNNVIRPLLAFSKDEILKYAQENNIQYRNDSSNNEDKYQRNFLRHQIIPKFKELNPSFETIMLQELQRLKDYNHILSKHFESEKNNLITSNENGIQISIDQLKKSDTPELLLFEAIKEYGFNSKEIEKILQSTENISGKHFKSDTHELLKDRDFLIIKKIESEQIIATQITKEQSEIEEPVKFKLQKVNAFKLEDSSSVAYVDAEKLTYPLTIRNWQIGDKFKPLGMKGFKKISDLFVDLKMNYFEKNKTLILENGNKEIIWVLNKRLDDRYKITDQTKEIIRLEIVGK
ncbi:MAG: tRNA lysidine(34) synthetase TilS [Sphingobacteriaceae bacterium]